MKHKTIILVCISFMGSASLISCKGSLNVFNQLGLSAPSEAPASASMQDGVTETPSTTTEEPNPAPELTSTPEESTSIETPDPAIELTITDEPTLTEQPEEESPATEEPATGFWEATSPDGQLRTVVPMDWSSTDNMEFQIKFNNEATAEGIDVLGLASPDQNAFIYLMAYDDDDILKWNTSLAQERVLRIINKIHTQDAEDVIVVDVRTLEDGSEQLTWSSDACNCTGFAAYKTGIKMGEEYLWICNNFYINSFEDDYAGIFDYVLEQLQFLDTSN